MPQRLGRYELLLPIASGGVATVHLAYSSGAAGFERNVAIKLTHPHLGDSPEFFTALVDEARLAGGIHHPNVVSVLDVGLAPRGVFIVMDYVEGDSLAVIQQVLKHRGERMPLPVALRILDHVAAGLHAAHELVDDAGRSLGVVHRDVTPHNILVGTDGISRLTDFGVAKAQSRLTKTSPGMIKGKVAYMSPEQAQGRPVDRTCDVWALGVVAWELLTGTRLYDGINDPVLMLKVGREPPMRARHVQADLPRELDEVVARALSMSPANRYPTAEAFAQALSEAARDAGLQRAEVREVKDFVRGLIGPRLEARREKAIKVRALRQRLGDLDPAVPTELALVDEPTAVITPSTSSPPPAPEPDLAEELEPPPRERAATTVVTTPRGIRVVREAARGLLTAPLTSRAWLLASLVPGAVVALVWVTTGVGGVDERTRGAAEQPALTRPVSLPGANPPEIAEPSATPDAEEETNRAPVITPQDLDIEQGEDAGTGDAGRR
jgi:serine/threonine-protein kinase